jgi:hypothetical protein
MHTPSPWLAVPNADPARAAIHGYEIMAGDIYVAATHTGLPDLEQHANANLLAAAPEMYGALGDVLADAPNAVANARAAWRKASGEVA